MKDKTILKLLCAVLLCAAGVQAVAAPAYYARTNADGLANSSITCISQDYLGRVWVGTWDGINVYDSQQFWTWQHDPGDSTTLSNNVIRDIVEQKPGIMWAATDYGVNRIFANKAYVQRFYLGYQHKTPSKEKTFGVSISSDGRVFCSAKDWGIAVFDEESSKMEAVNIPGFNTAGISSITCLGTDRLLLLSESGDTYLVTYGFDKDRNIDIIPAGNPLPDRKVRSVFSGRDRLYVLSEDGSLICLSRDSCDVTGSIRLPAKDAVTSVAETTDGSIAVGFENLGICTIGLETGDCTWAEEMSGMNILSLFYGTQDILWAGTDGQGLWAFYEDPFKMNKMPYSRISTSRTHYPVRAFCKDSDGNLYIGTRGDGIFVMNDGKTVRRYSEELGSSSVYALYADPSGDILAGHDGEGFSVISGDTGKVSRIVPDRQAMFGSVCCFLPDTARRCIWLGTSGYGLVQIRLERTGGGYSTDVMNIYRGREGDPYSINNSMVQSMAMEGDSILWIGTRGGGLDRMDIEAGTFSHFTTSTGEHPVSSNDILSLHISKDSTLWTGTSFGLNRLVSVKDGQYDFESFTTREMLHNNTIHGIEEDKEGNLWLSTSHGLSVFDPATLECTNYYNDNKLQDNEYSDGAYYQDSDGTIFFGGIGGFNWFDPEDIKPRDFEPKILISRVTLIQAPDVDLMDDPEHITLRHNENFFSIHYTALEFINNSNCEYAYKLDGFNTDWVYARTEHSASFTNVPPGRYTFMVKSTNGDKTWGNNITSMEIRILPPWWATIWAYIAYTAIAAGLIYLINRALNMRIRQRHRLELETLKRKQLHETYEAKLRFFTNIAHEFTTPLTLICGPIEQIMNEYKLPPKVEKYNRIILSNAERMLRLIQELIEFRKADTGNRKPRYSRVDMTEMILTVLDNFSEMKEEKQIDLETSIGQGMSAVTDHNAMEKILYNLISNAFKYTPDGGWISVSAQEGDDGLVISVKNSGKGIKPENLERVFDRFVILDNYEHSAGKGTLLRNGIGMALVSSLVKTLSGEITADSEPGKYTVFTVRLPHVGEDMITDASDQTDTDKFRLPPAMLHEKEDMEETDDRQGRSDTGKRKIMIVDDEAQIRDLVKDILEPEYSIVQATDGKNAIDKLKDGIPDLIISDLNMPNMNGTELLRYLKSNEITKFIPVIFLAFKTDIGDEIETYNMGSEVFIPKPFYPKHLKAVVHRILDSRSMLRDYYNSAISSKDIYDGATVDTGDKKFLMQLTSLIEQNITDEELSPNWLCDKMAMSRMQFYRKLKELTGQTPSEFIRSIKLEKAAHLLKTTRLTVQEVMYSSGFNNKSYFYREFAGKYKMSPKEYRKA